MNLKMFNTTADELAIKKHPIFIGISINIKPINPEIVRSYFSWALQHSDGKIQILIADEIAKFNYMAFSHSTVPGALSRAIRDGDKYEAFFQKILNELPRDISNAFNIIRWKNIQSEQFRLLLNEVSKEFECNELFRKEILSFVDIYAARRDKTLTEKRKLQLSLYVLHELPTLLDGIYVDEKNYNLILYPTYLHAGLSELVSDIQSGKRFPALKNRLNLKKTIMVEAIISEDEQSIPSLMN